MNCKAGLQNNQVAEHASAELDVGCPHFPLVTKSLHQNPTRVQPKRAVCTQVVRHGAAYAASTGNQGQGPCGAPSRAQAVL